jgi:thiol-disulfide isomerase/thioredoxin
MEAKDLYRYLLIMTIAIQTPLSAQSAAGSYACEAPAQIQAAIREAGSIGMESLLQKQPNDFWIRLAYIDSKGSRGLRGGAGIRQGPPWDLTIARLRNEYELRPEDPEAAYLYASALINGDRAKSIEVLTELIQKFPSFPRAWLTLAMHYENDTTKVRSYTENFLALCPNTIDSKIISLVAKLDKHDIQVSYAHNVRERISGKSGEELNLFEYLWGLESKIALPSEQGEFRKRLEADMKFLEGMDKSRSLESTRLLLIGKALLNGNTAVIPVSNPLLTAAQLQTARERKQQQASNSAASKPVSNQSSTASFVQARSEWLKANPEPGSAANEKTRTNYYKKLLQFFDEWRDKYPQDANLLPLQFKMLSSIPDIPDDVLVNRGNQILSAVPYPANGGSPTTSFEVLKTWAQRGLELDRIPVLVREIAAKRQRTNILSYPMQQPGLTSMEQTFLEENRWRMDTDAWAILVTVYSKTRQAEQAWSILVVWEAALKGRRAKVNEIAQKPAPAPPWAADSKTINTSSLVQSNESFTVSGIPYEDSKYYEACAQAAAAEGQTLDALVFYQTSMRLRYNRVMPFSNTTLDAEKESNKLWTKLGGSQASWRIWLDSIRTTPSTPAQRVPEPASKIQLPVPDSMRAIPGSAGQRDPQSSRMSRSLPPFSLADQNGETWTHDSFKGKTTLINVWAVWCGPCRSELPLLQKLYEQIKDRNDVQVITLNVDSDPKRVEPFLKKNKFTFPSLFAKSLVADFVGNIAIPTTWISDATGTIRTETLGFSGGGPDWVSQTLKTIENIGRFPNQGKATYFGPYPGANR